MPGWDSYRAVYGAEVRAAAREFLDHGWPVVEECADTLMLITGSALDVLEVPAAIGRGICAQLRAADIVVPVAATPTGAWWYPVTPGAALPVALRVAEDVVLHAGDAIAAPPSQVPDGWVHWRVPPAACDFGVAAAELDLLRRSDSSGAAGRRRRTSGRPAARRCGRRRNAVLRRPRPRLPDPPALQRPSRRAAGTRDAVGATRRGGTSPAYGVAPQTWPGSGGSPPTPASTNQRRRLREPNAVGRMGANTRPTTLPPAGSPTPGGVVRAAARERAPDDPDAGYSEMQALWVRDDLTNPPIGRRSRRSRSSGEYSGRGVRPGLRADGRRHPGEGPAEDEARRHEPAARRRGDLPGCARWWEVNAGPVWIGYVRAMAEAGMVGALADWFAVTALFRRPLGLPIPHTAIIPTKKDAARRQPGRVRRRELPRPRTSCAAGCARVGIGRRLGAWLGRARARRPGHRRARRRPLRGVADRAARLRRAGGGRRGDHPARGRPGDRARHRQDAGEGRRGRRPPPAGRPGRATRAHDWLVLHGDSVMDAVQGGAPGWTPRFVDRKVGERVYKELLRFVTEMRDMPGPPGARRAGPLPHRLRRRPAVRHGHPGAGRAAEGEMLAPRRGPGPHRVGLDRGPRMIVAAAEDERSELRLRVRASLLSPGQPAGGRPELQAKVDGWVEGAAVYVVDHLPATRSPR